MNLRWISLLVSVMERSSHRGSLYQSIDSTLATSLLEIVIFETERERVTKQLADENASMPETNEKRKY